MTGKPTTDKLKIGVLASGRGSNLAAIHAQIRTGQLGVELALVASNYADCRAIALAREWGAPTQVFPREVFASRRERDGVMADVFDAAGVGLVVLAGYDRILHPNFIGRFANRIINTHNSLLPAFGGVGIGLRAPAEALAHGVKLAGCTVHFVTDGVDAGPIIIQRAVPVLDDDTVETLSARILAEEHVALPDAIRYFASGRLRILGRRVFLLPAPPSKAV